MNRSFTQNIDFLNPVNCLNLNFEQSVNILKAKIGIEKYNSAFNVNYQFPSIISNYKDTSWCKTVKIVGINPRITKTYWGIIKYALSFPENAIHIMPLWETGDGSLYVQNSWKLNDEFLDNDLIKLGYKTSDSQLKLTVNVLHAMDKVVGLDALLHCDNFSKIVLLNPKLFEWVKLNNSKTSQIPFCDIDYNNLYFDIQNIIINTLHLPENLFELDEEKREKLIFPKGIDEFKRRMDLREKIREAGYEPIPVVEHSPSRPVIFEKIIKSGDKSWAEFCVKNKNNAAKIFGAVTPYKLYLTDEYGYPEKNGFWEESWDYFSSKIYEFQKKYNFDFLRADMAHNQTSHSHKNNEKDINCPELWAYVKDKITKEKPYFATAAESFYSTYYVDGISDMINKNFDIVIGDMNFKKIDKLYLNLIDDFVNPFRQNFPFYPCTAIFTNDGDLEFHNQFFKSNKQNLARCFISLFLNLPSYMGMGFELRDINPKKSNNYSNYYVKKQEKDYEFGDNISFLNDFNKIRKIYTEMKHIIDNYVLKLIYSTDNELSLCFEYSDNNKNNYLVVVNLNENKDTVCLNEKYSKLNLLFSLDNDLLSLTNDFNNIKIRIKPWEFAIYECKK